MAVRNRLKFRARIALAFGFSIAVAGCAMTPEQQAEMIEQTMLADQVSRGNWEAIKEDYPKEFAALVEQIRVEYDRNGNNLAPALAKADEWLVGFHNRIQPDVNRAPAKALLEWSTSDYELLALLEKQDVEQCARLVRGESTIIKSAIPEVNAAIAVRGEMTIRAAAAGRDNPQEYKTPSNAQFIALEQAIRKTGMDERLFEAFGSPDAMDALSVPEQCKIGVSLAQAIETMPDKDAAQLTAHMLKRGPS